MFTIMENRKRPRLELINTNNNSTDSMQGVASTASTMGSATLATIGGQSFLLSNTSASTLPANILLSICDDNSNESEEYIIDSSMLTQIKHENTVATQTSNTQQQQQPTIVATAMPQYRIINPTGKILNNSLNSNAVVNTPVTTNSSIISNSVHLPPGCEIYVIKEVIDSPKQVIAESTTSPKQLGNTTIKLEPMSPLPAYAAGSLQIVRNSSITNNTAQNLKSTSNNISSISLNSSTTSSTATCSSPAEDNVKRSLILEAYKKRDDKRRATHNEVERRRRDKINSWIFKLKEMLPTELTPSNSFLNYDSSCAAQPALNHNTNTRLLVQPGTARTPPSDSKSQILIKACEYIKSMQDEIQSLRECLTENENLRLSNQRLQEEINTLRNKQQHLHNTNNNNNMLLNTNNDNDDCEITLNSLNATYANVQLFAPTSANNSTTLAGLVGLTTNSNVNTTPKTVNVTYAKRELIIRDYVD